MSNSKCAYVAHRKRFNPRLGRLADPFESYSTWMYWYGVATSPPGWRANPPKESDILANIDIIKSSMLLNGKQREDFIKQNIEEAKKAYVIK